ncbi:MAG: Uma2 family endonuclease [Runella slithyformis]|nr:MAG: Uma2 family endonuclease [Runella slithyformis]TAE96959.1 MAG: Uma2 family endonuclease [Runella slithyformis]TAF28132.1 MAG: Uma2 family endonuclease [Runella slithyformis]TAF46736.1 MAG: Uma2 family endonuclease [Runella slithyformis]TAF81575.1 MAG: Uma2 family endonuclease [Runella slithyformis]
MAAEIKNTVLPRTMAEFENWETNDSYKYEWNDGEIIKFEGMKNKHLYLISNLSELFDKTIAKKQRGQLICEQDVMLTGIQMRRPDLAYFSWEQILKSKTEVQIPEFVIEVISTFDQILEVKRKVIEYFKSGVKVVWLMYPEEQMVEIYTSAKHITVCTDDDLCSASPVLEDFEIPTSQLWT